MIGPNHTGNSSDDTSRSRRDELGEVFDRSDATATDECELCECERRTNQEYGMQVCQSCARELLP